MRGFNQKGEIILGCGDARSMVDCDSCRFKIECVESSERYKYTRMSVSKCPKCKCGHAILGKIKFCSECGGLMGHGVVPSKGKIEFSILLN